MSGAATASAVAAAISASFAGGTSVAAWVTIRRRRPRLIVRVQIGNPGGGALHPNETGDIIAVRVANVRETDLEVLDLWFETDEWRRRLPGRFRRLPITYHPSIEHFDPDAGLIPGTVRAHHTELYSFRTEDLGVALLEGGHGRYRAAVAWTGTPAFRGEWFDVSPTEEA